MSWYYGKNAEIADLLGKTLAQVLVNGDNDEIRFVTDAGETYVMYHSQSCCEHVYIESITGDLLDLIDSPILKAEAAESSENPPNTPAAILEYQDSFTWTFYKLATIKGYVDIRWYGSSNGYYGESVDLVLLEPEAS